MLADVPSSSGSTASFLSGYFPTRSCDRSPSLACLQWSLCYSTFFNEITEVSGYIFLQNIPTLSLLTFPRLRLIRGADTISSQALAIVSSNIARLFMPRLTEITNGGVTFNNPAAPLCSADSINWSDIISSSTSSYTGPTCTGQGNTQSLSSVLSLPSLHSLPCLSRQIKLR